MSAPQARLNHNQTTPRSNKRSAVSQSQSLITSFSFPPRVQHVLPAPRRSKKASHLVWNPERFINAQYRFCLKPTGDYTVHFADPDIYFQWHDILQVILPRSVLDQEGTNDSSGTATCPICLSPPTAARMTKCGHIFCFPCIIHYIETGDTPKWHRCPLCTDSINAAQLKSVCWSDAPTKLTPVPGTIIKMRLIQRPHITTLALPRSDTWHTASQGRSDLLQPHEAPFHFLPDVEKFARFMLATPDQLTLDITRDIDELDREEHLLRELGDELGVTFVCRAREKCLGMLIKVQEMEQDAALRVHIERKRNLLRDAMSQAALRGVREAAIVAAGNLPITPMGPSPVATLPQAPAPYTPARPGRNKRSLNPPPHSSSSYYYYQAASGANVFLHPLDIRVLLTQFGSYESFPNDISVLVIGASESTVDDELRRRCKYLAYLPEGADVVFVELDLDNIVGTDTLKQFDNLLKTRKARHKEKAKKEDKARLRAEERERDNLYHTITAQTSTHARASDSARWEPSPVILVGDDLHNEDNDNSPLPAVPALAPVITGAWGPRSFASAAQSSSVSQGTAAPSPLSRDDDDWELDQAWYELEEAQLKGGGSGRGGQRRGRQKKLVLLGSGAGVRRT